MQNVITKSTVISPSVKEALNNLSVVLPEDIIQPITDILEDAQAKIDSKVEQYFLSVQASFSKYKAKILSIDGLSLRLKAQIVSNVNTIETAIMENIIKSLS